MSRSWKRRMWMMAAVVGAGSVFQFPRGCADYWTQLTIGGVDFCAVLNCTGSTFFDFCTPVPYLADCPNTEQQP